MLIVIYSFLLLILLGAGGLLGRVVGARRHAFTALALGISALHLLTLVGVPIVGVIVAVTSMAAVEGLLARRTPRAPIAGSDVRWLVAIFASTLPLWVFFMSKPLWAFDSRNVWFFAGRIIYGEGRFPLDVWHRLPCYWGADYRLCMNPDYPKLIGALSAAVATLAGYWNEYLPKLSELLLHSLVLLGLYELGWRCRAIALVAVMTLAMPYRYFFDSAYVDLHVAMLLLVSLLAFGRAVGERARGHDDDASLWLAGALATLGLASQVKYEGRLLAGIVFVAALVTRATTLRELWGARRVLAVVFLPTVVWFIEVKAVHSHNYFEYGPPLSVVLERAKRDVGVVLVGAVFRPAILACAALVLLAAVVARRRAPDLSWGALARDPGVLLGFVVAALYSGALCAIYIATPYSSPTEHLISSASRTVLSTQAALLAAASIVFDRARSAR